MDIPIEEIRDRMYWRPTTNGWFSMASALEIITNQEHADKGKYNWI